MFRLLRSGYLIDVIVHLVGHFFELVVGYAEVSLVRVEVSVLPAAPSLSLIHVGWQVEGCLEGLGGSKEKTVLLLLHNNTEGSPCLPSNGWNVIFLLFL